MRTMATTAMEETAATPADSFDHPFNKQQSISFDHTLVEAFSLAYANVFP